MRGTGAERIGLLAAEQGIPLFEMAREQTTGARRAAPRPATSTATAQAAQALQQTGGDDLLEQVPGGLVLAAYVAALALAGALLLGRRDVTE